MDAVKTMFVPRLRRDKPWLAAYLQGRRRRRVAAAVELPVAPGGGPGAELLGEAGEEMVGEDGSPMTGE